MRKMILAALISAAAVSSPANAAFYIELRGFAPSVSFQQTVVGSSTPNFWTSAAMLTVVSQCSTLALCFDVATDGSTWNARVMTGNTNVSAASGSYINAVTGNIADGQWHAVNGTGVAGGACGGQWTGCAPATYNFYAIRVYEAPATYQPSPSYAFITQVPEPATWAMMIGGFALAGGLVRTKRRLAFS